MMEVSDLAWGACGEVVTWLGDHEKGILACIAITMTALGILVLIDNRKPDCGRYLADKNNSKQGLIDNRIAAILTYPPAFLIPLFCVYTSKSATHVNIVIVMLMVSHYLQRTFIYGILIRGNSKIPLRVLRESFIFCTLNGYMIGRYHTEYAEYDVNWLTDPRFLTGISMFFIGMFINIHSDHILRNLRKPGETGYKIPRGGMFEYVSGANYFGEVVEWTGFAVACWTPHSMCFAIFTAGYIGVVKAFSHHRWYLEKFEDYPRSRKAIIPFII